MKKCIMPILWKSYNGTDIVIIIYTMRPVHLSFFAHVLEVGTPTLTAHLNALQDAGAHPIRGVCWPF